MTDFCSQAALVVKACLVRSALMCGLQYNLVRSVAATKEWPHEPSDVRFFQIIGNQSRGD